jgi:multisubunit Na+/H+ antiporter MnhB subunit
VLVPVGVFAGAPGVVAIGSVVLLAALALFAAATSVRPRRRARDHRFWLYAYGAIVIFLAGSVVVGTGLADALPWQ